MEGVAEERARVVEWKPIKGRLFYASDARHATPTLPRSPHQFQIIPLRRDYFFPAIRPSHICRCLRLFSPCSTPSPDVSLFSELRKASATPGQRRITNFSEQLFRNPSVPQAD